jgi:hypothetical protein
VVEEPGLLQRAPLPRHVRAPVPVAGLTQK